MNDGPHDAGRQMMEGAMTQDERKLLLDDVLRTIRDVPDFPKPGIMFKDITPVLQDGALFPRVCRFFADMADANNCNVVAGIESRGFLFAAPVAAMLGLPLVVVRKPGKLPWKTKRAEYSLEYGTDAIEMHVDAVKGGDRVLLLDDLLATGGTMQAAVGLVRELGAEVGMVGFMIELGFLDGRMKLNQVPVDSLVTL